MCAKNLPNACRELAEAHDACLDRYSSEACRRRPRTSEGGWGGGGPPQGVSIRRPTVGGPRRAGHEISMSKARLQMLSLVTLSPDVLIPISKSLPGRGGRPESRSKIPPSATLFGSWLDFFAFRIALEKLHRKNVEKNAKIENVGFQNGLKIGGFSNIFAKR